MKSEDVYKKLLKNKYDVYKTSYDGLSQMICLRELNQKFINYLEVDSDLNNLNMHGYNDLEAETIDYNDKNKSLFDELYDIVQDVNVQKGWNFDIKPVSRLNRLFYDIDRNDAHYDVYHMDYNPHQIPNRKISISIQLSNPEEYEGGDLKLMYGFKEHIVPKKKGTIVIFPSFVLHKVEPVTKGRRISLVTWYEGGSHFR